jgi:YbbR domain-containing protein
MAYEEYPDSLILVSSPPSELKVRLRANGFYLLRYQLSPKAIRVDLGVARRQNGNYFITPDMYRSEVERQLDDAVALLEIPRDTLFLNFQTLRSKTIPVRVHVAVELGQNYMLEGPLIVDPPRIHVLGPPEEIDTLEQIQTESLILSDVRESFRQEVPLAGITQLPNTRFSTPKVRVSGEVFRFSEIVIDVPIEVVNVPVGTEIRTFPEQVGVLCKGKIDVLKSLSPGDFSIVADFQSPDPETGRLPLLIDGIPETVKSTTLLESSVEFIVRRE